jgi:hypothetical protein
MTNRQPTSGGPVAASDSRSHCQFSFGFGWADGQSLTRCPPQPVLFLRPVYSNCLPNKQWSASKQRFLVLLVPGWLDSAQTSKSTHSTSFRKKQPLQTQRFFHSTADFACISFSDKWTRHLGKTILFKRSMTWACFISHGNFHDFT